LLLVPAVTWLASRVAPGVFDYSEMETRARELVDAADGAWFLLLTVVVVIGAPLVEEAVYRGFLQGTLRRSVAPWAATLVVAALFAVIHFSVVEMPGLFAFAIVLGICFERSGGLALPIVAHMSFNATAVVLLAVLE
jgi:membrane protease YdiL (CAAX protease family)